LNIENQEAKMESEKLKNGTKEFAHRCAVTIAD
jgi:hypothetical protein